MLKQHVILRDYFRTYAIVRKKLCDALQQSLGPQFNMALINSADQGSSDQSISSSALLVLHTFALLMDAHNHFRSDLKRCDSYGSDNNADAVIKECLHLIVAIANNIFPQTNEINTTQAVTTSIELMLLYAMMGTWSMHEDVRSLSMLGDNEPQKDAKCLVNCAIAVEAVVIACLMCMSTFAGTSAPALNAASSIIPCAITRSYIRMHLLPAVVRHCDPESLAASLRALSTINMHVKIMPTSGENDVTKSTMITEHDVQKCLEELTAGAGGRSGRRLAVVAKTAISYTLPIHLQQRKVTALNIEYLKNQLQIKDVKNSATHHQPSLAATPPRASVAAVTERDTNEIKSKEDVFVPACETMTAQLHNLCHIFTAASHSIPNALGATDLLIARIQSENDGDAHDDILSNLEEGEGLQDESMPSVTHGICAGINPPPTLKPLFALLLEENYRSRELVNTYADTVSRITTGGEMNQGEGLSTSNGGFTSIPIHPVRVATVLLDVLDAASVHDLLGPSMVWEVFVLGAAGGDRKLARALAMEALSQRIAYSCSLVSLAARHGCSAVTATASTPPPSVISPVKSSTKTTVADVQPVGDRSASIRSAPTAPAKPTPSSDAKTLTGKTASEVLYADVLLVGRLVSIGVIPSPAIGWEMLCLGLYSGSFNTDRNEATTTELGSIASIEDNRELMSAIRRFSLDFEKCANSASAEPIMNINIPGAAAGAGGSGKFNRFANRGNLAGIMDGGNGAGSPNASPRPTSDIPASLVIGDYFAKVTLSVPPPQWGNTFIRCTTTSDVPRLTIIHFVAALIRACAFSAAASVIHVARKGLLPDITVEQLTGATAASPKTSNDISDNTPAELMLAPFVASPWGSLPSLVADAILACIPGDVDEAFLKPRILPVKKFLRHCNQNSGVETYDQSADSTHSAENIATAKAVASAGSVDDIVSPAVASRHKALAMRMVAWDRIWPLVQCTASFLSSVAAMQRCVDALTVGLKMAYALEGVPEDTSDDQQVMMSSSSANQAMADPDPFTEGQIPDYLTDLKIPIVPLPKQQEFPWGFRWRRRACAFFVEVLGPTLPLLPPCPLLNHSSSALLLMLPHAVRAPLLLTMTEAATNNTSSSNIREAKRDGNARKRSRTDDVTDEERSDDDAVDEATYLSLLYNAPHARVPLLKHKTLLTHCLNRVTATDTRMYSAALQPVLYGQPWMVVDRLLRKAVGYSDPSLLLTSAQLLKDSPPLVFACLPVLAMARIQQAADSIATDLYVAEKRIIAISTFLAFALRQSWHEIDESFLFHSALDALQKGSRSGNVIALPLLRLIFHRVLHIPLEHQDEPTPPQLAALSTGGNLIKFFAGGRGESFLMRMWLPSMFSPKTLDRNRRLITEALRTKNVGSRLVHLLLHHHRTIFHSYADLPGTVFQTMRQSADDTDVVGDLAAALFEMTQGHISADRRSEAYSLPCLARTASVGYAILFSNERNMLRQSLLSYGRHLLSLDKYEKMWKIKQQQQQKQNGSNGTSKESDKTSLSANIQTETQKNSNKGKSGAEKDSEQNNPQKLAEEMSIDEITKRLEEKRGLVSSSKRHVLRAMFAFKQSGADSLLHLKQMDSNDGMNSDYGLANVNAGDGSENEDHLHRSFTPIDARNAVLLYLLWSFEASDLAAPSKDTMVAATDMHARFQLKAAEHLKQLSSSRRSKEDRNHEFDVQLGDMVKEWNESQATHLSAMRAFRALVNEERIDFTSPTVFRDAEMKASSFYSRKALRESIKDSDTPSGEASQCSSPTVTKNQKRTRDQNDKDNAEQNDCKKKHDGQHQYFNMNTQKAQKNMRFPLLLAQSILNRSRISLSEAVYCARLLRCLASPVLQMTGNHGMHGNIRSTMLLLCGDVDDSTEASGNSNHSVAQLAIALRHVLFCFVSLVTTQLIGFTDAETRRIAHIFKESLTLAHELWYLAEVMPEVKQLKKKIEKATANPMHTKKTLFSWCDNRDQSMAPVSFDLRTEVFLTKSLYHTLQNQGLPSYAHRNVLTICEALFRLSNDSGTRNSNISPPPPRSSSPSNSSSNKAHGTSFSDKSDVIPPFMFPMTSHSAILLSKAMSTFTEPENVLLATVTSLQHRLGNRIKENQMVHGFTVEASNRNEAKKENDCHPTALFHVCSAHQFAEGMVQNMLSSVWHT